MIYSRISIRALLINYEFETQNTAIQLLKE